jgi:UDP-glucose 4-epimerase
MILVAGGAGYIGSHMAKTLIQAKREIVIVDNLSTGHNELIVGGRFLLGDIGDSDFLDSVFSRFPISAVLHFAAYSIVGESVANPLKYYDNNVAKTLTLLKTMIHHQVKRFIFSSTASVFGIPEEIPIVEEARTAPINPYGATKLAVEGLLRDCDYAYGLRFASLRYFNAAGADESAEIGEMHNPETHLIPLVLKAANGERENIVIYGQDYDTPDGSCIRDYIHVYDLAAAHLLALEALESGASSDVYNLGNNRGYSVKEVIKAAVKVTGKSIPVIVGERRAGDPPILIASSTKIQRQLGFMPQFQDIETIIHSAWKWENRKKSGDSFM